MFKVKCPICRKPMEGTSVSEWPTFPFCSPRCRLIDLGRWLGEDYRLPSEPEDEEFPAAEDEDTDTP